MKVRTPEKLTVEAWNSPGQSQKSFHRVFSLNLGGHEQQEKVLLYASLDFSSLRKSVTELGIGMATFEVLSRRKLVATSCYFLAPGKGLEPSVLWCSVMWSSRGGNLVPTMPVGVLWVPSYPLSFPTIATCQDGSYTRSYKAGWPAMSLQPQILKVL